MVQPLAGNLTFRVKNDDILDFRGNSEIWSRINGIDFVVDQVGSQIKKISHLLSIWQSGKVRVYALNMIAGTVFLLIFVVFL